MLTFGLYLPNLRRVVPCQLSEGFNSIGQYKGNPKAFNARGYFL